MAPIKTSEQRTALHNYTLIITLYQREQINFQFTDTFYN